MLVTGRRPGTLAPFEQVRPAVEREWYAERRAAAQDEQFNVLLARYKVVVLPREQAPMKLARGLAAVLLWLLAAQAARAHEVRPAFLQLREAAPNEFQMTWKVPALGRVPAQHDPGAARLLPRCGRARPGLGIGGSRRAQQDCVCREPDRA